MRSTAGSRSWRRNSSSSWSSRISIPTIRLKPPIGRSGRPEIGRQSYSIAAVNEFDPLFDDIYAFCEAQDIEIDTLIHEDGAAQMEINLLHGNALSLADQVFLFKRTAREAALRHKMYATFMAKPMAREPGSAMHIHQSIVDSQQRARTSSAIPDGTPSRAVLLAHRRTAEVPAGRDVAVRAQREFLSAHHAAISSAPINMHWGYDNRTAGLRVPMSEPETGGSRTASAAPTPIPTSPSPPRWPAAIWAWSRA